MILLMVVLGVDNIDGGAGNDQINVSNDAEFVSLASPETILMVVLELHSTFIYRRQHQAWQYQVQIYIILKILRPIEFDGNAAAAKYYTLDDIISLQRQWISIH